MPPGSVPRRVKAPASQRNASGAELVPWDHPTTTLPSALTPVASMRLSIERGSPSGSKRGVSQRAPKYGPSHVQRTSPFGALHSPRPLHGSSAHGPSSSGAPPAPPASGGGSGSGPLPAAPPCVSPGPSAAAPALPGAPAAPPEVPPLASLPESPPAPPSKGPPTAPAAPPAPPSPPPSPDTPSAAAPEAPPSEAPPSEAPPSARGSAGTE